MMGSLNYDMEVCLNKVEREIIAPQKGKQELMLSADADFIVVGSGAGSGKSRALLMRSLLQIHDPKFEAVYFRRQTGHLRNAGGLFSEAKKLYAGFKPRVQDNEMKFTFKSGSTVKFSHLEHDKDVMSWQGLQLSAILVDEICQFSEYQINYLMTRLRSEAKSKSYLIGSCNPESGSWLLKYVDWYLDKDGYPDESKCGVVRYYVMEDGDPRFGDSEEELREKYPTLCQVYNPNDDEFIDIPPKTFTFINANIYDNRIMLKQNPTYLANLNAQPDNIKMALLHGNWYHTPTASKYFQREWLKKASSIPLNSQPARGWDKAATEPSQVNREPDYTASVKMWKDMNNEFYIVGDYITEGFDDKDNEVLGRFRKTAGARDKLIQKQAEHDGRICHVIFPQDPSGAGKVEFTESAKKLTVGGGFLVYKDPKPTQMSKLNRFLPFASACENGMVHIVESTFNPKTLEAFYKELEKFDGERSTRTRKDD